MKNYIIIFLIFINISCNEKKTNKTYLANYVESIKEKHSLTENPLVLIDGYVEQYELMNDGAFLLLEEDIVNTEYLKKETAFKIYGEKGKNGAVLVKTILSELGNKNSNSDKKTIYVLDGKIISKNAYHKIEKNKIIGIATILEKNAIKELTSEKCDELIYVTTEMPKK
ncbi:hypothetical protein [Polaribacter butkevichii]|nr:hypothetical protein [Polaribacter butkevichii]